MAATNTPTWQDVVDEHATHRARAEEDAANPHVPDLDLPVSDVVTYRTIAITEVSPPRVEATELREPVDLLGADADHRADEPAVGVILHVEQAWRVKEMALGRLLHSLPLAPAEVTQVAMVGWDRSTGSSTRQDLSEQEQADRAVSRTRDIHDVTALVGSETNAGGSSASSLSHHSSGGVGGLLGFLGGVSGGGSSSSSTAFGINWNTGSRSAAAASTQNLRQRTSHHVSNTRAKVATLVQEVGQSESERFSSRVVANHNHMHSLNVQYYEVLQVYELAARPVRAERCLFLPMEVMHFTSEAIVTHARALARAARAMGRPSLAATIEQNASDQDVAARNLRRIDEELRPLRVALQPLHREQADLRVLAGRHGAELEGLVARRLETEQRIAVQTTRLMEAELAVARWHEDHRAIDQARDVADFFKTLGREIEDLVTESSGTTLEAVEQRRTEARRTRDQLVQFHAMLLAEISEVERRRPDAALLAAVEARITETTRRITDLETRRREESDAADAEAAALIREMDEDRLALNQAMWLQLDPATIGQLVARFTHLGERVAPTLDPRPVAIEGNYVGFRWGFADDDEGRDRAAAFQQRYVHDHQEPALDTHVVPTGGLFAEAVPGRSNAAERLDLTRYWKWDEDTIPIRPTAIDTLRTLSHAAPAAATPGELAAPVVQASPLPAAPPGPSHALTAVIGSTMFRDLSGGAAIRQLLETGQAKAAAGSDDAMEQAHQNISAVLDHAEQLLPLALEALKASQGAPSSPGGIGSPGGGEGGLDPSDLGSLSNAVGEGAELDPEALLGTAAELGMLL